MHRLVVILLVALLVPAAAEAANPVLSAVERTAKARSATFQLEATTKVTGAPAIVMRGGGATKGTSVKLSVRVSGGQAFTMDAVGLPERGGFVMYLRSPAFEGQLPPGKSWLRVDLQKEAANLGLDFSSLSSSQSLAPLEHGLVSTKRVGSARVAGNPTTHYRAIVDLRRAAAAVPAFGAQVARIERALGVRLGRQTQDVWVDRDGRIRRYSFTMPTGTSRARGTAVQSMTFLAFDVPVSISAPPRAQVFDTP